MRIAGIDIPDNKRGEVALTYIYGLGRSSAIKILNDEKNSETFKEMLKAFPDADLIEVQKEDE